VACGNHVFLMSVRGFGVWKGGCFWTVDGRGDSRGIGWCDEGVYPHRASQSKFCLARGACVDILGLRRGPCARNGDTEMMRHDSWDILIAMSALMLETME
jgi:hypothetical protein